MVGCASTKTTLQSVNAAYVGKNADAFFIKHGPPLSAFQLDQGGVIYRWQSNVKNYNMPATTTHNGTVNSYGYTGTSVTSGGGNLSVYTTLQIDADTQNTITQISILEDTIGKWQLSRFNELFDDYDDMPANKMGSNSQK